MQPIPFPGAVEIKKPDSMTDEQCMSVWAHIHINEQKQVQSFTTLWIPSYEDMQAFSRGGGIFIQTRSPRRAYGSIYFRRKWQCK